MRRDSSFSYSSPSSVSLRSMASANPELKPRESSSAMNSEIASLFLNNKFSDITLKLVEPALSSSMTESGQVEDARDKRREVPAHTFILKLRSGYFETRFNFEATAASTSNRGVTATPESLEVHLSNGITKSTFMAMLEFLYTDRVPNLTADSLVDTLIAADFYQVASLHQHCLQAMKPEILNKENMFVLLLEFHSRTPQMAEAKEVCLDYIDTHFDSLPPIYEIEETTKILTMPRELLCEMIRRDSLCAEEVNIAVFILFWAAEECKRQGMGITGTNMRQVLGEALYLVRFPLIDAKWFGDLIVSRKILTDEEVLGIFLHNTMSNPPSIPFSSVRRVQPKPSPAVLPKPRRACGVRPS